MNSKKIIHLLVGIQGSGKTVYSKTLSKELNCNVVSTDILRQNGILEQDIFKLTYQTIFDELNANHHVIYDATNITPKVRSRLVNNLKDLGLNYNVDYSIISYYFPTSVDVCRQRVSIRNTLANELSLPLDVINSYELNIIPPLYDEGFSEYRVVTSCPKLLEGVISDSMQGYALYLSQNETIIEEYSGFSNINHTNKINSNTNFRLASVTKQFIAYGILSLVNKKLLTLETKLSEVFDIRSEVKVKHLLNHTSGILDYEDYKNEFVLNESGQINDTDVLEFYKRHLDTYFEIGSNYRYSNTGYILLGKIIEEVTKMNIVDFIQNEIFTPLEMNNSYVCCSEVKNRALGHERVDDVLRISDQYWCSNTVGDGGIYSNINDLKKWLNKLKTSRKFPFNKMFETSIINGVDIEYGYGLRVIKVSDYTIYFHCGSTIGFNTLVLFSEQLNLDLIFLTNESKIDTKKIIENLTNRITESSK